MMKNVFLPVAIVAALAVACGKGETPPPKNPRRAGSAKGTGTAKAPPPRVAAPKGDWPATKRQDIVDTLHGAKVEDPYRWLEYWGDDAVKVWTRAQDKYARAKLAKMPGRAALARRLKELFYVDSVSAPGRKG